ncbi:MAG: hypothetical protein QY317_16265 [Candidatus Jettenia caeni]|nr:MAG: hypothetical protein QY317_16265 [Candidatus Jettenia caeni]
MLTEIIYRVAEELQEDRQPYRHRPSSACKCIRSLVYHALGIEAKRLPGRALLVFDDGNWGEELTIDWISKSAYKVHSRQMKVDIFEVNGKMVSGSIDGILQTPLGDEYLFEHKNINHFSFQRIQEDPTTAHEYFVQCALYLHGLQKVQPDIKEAVLCIKNKNTAQYCEYLVSHDYLSDKAEVYRFEGTQKGELVHIFNSTVAITYKVFELVDYCVDTQTIPTRPHQRGDWQCSYCAWEETCWEGYVEEVEAMPQGVDLTPHLRSEVVKEYLDKKALKAEIEKREKELRKEIQTALDAHSIKAGYIGDVEVVRNFREVKGFLVQPRTDEILTVKKRKERECTTGK